MRSKLIIKQIPLREKILGPLIVFGIPALAMSLFFGYQYSSARQKYKDGYEVSHPIVNANSSRDAYYKCLDSLILEYGAGWQCTKYKRALKRIRPVPTTLLRQSNGLSKGTMTYE